MVLDWPAAGGGDGGGGGGGGGGAGGGEILEDKEAERCGEVQTILPGQTGP